MLSDDGPEELTARGARVLVRPVAPQDVEPYRLAVAASAERIGRWNPVDPERVQLDLAEQSPSRRTFVVRALDPAGSHGLVGRVNVSNVVHGTFLSASMGYDAYDPYVGTGLFREGLSLVVDVAFRRLEDGGMGLHRVEANVQPGNARSAGVLRSLGFRHEGETPRMLWLGGPDGSSWRDHERYAVTSEEWPATPYAPHARRRRVVLVNGRPGSGKTTVARALAAELALPLLQKDLVKEAGAHEALWSLLAFSPTGAVVESWWRDDVRPLVEAGLRGADVDPAAVVEVWCDVPATTAGERWAAASPLGLGPVVRVPTSEALSPGAVARLALDVRSRCP
ncbi:hypothetical protein GCM10027446_30960 [Angustibacter peucedani]